MRVKLNYVEPPVKCYLHHAFPLGVFWDENDRDVMNWFCLNYNYMLGSKTLDDFCYTYLVNFNSIPFLQKREVYGDELEKYIVTHSFAQLVKELIDNGNFVELFADLFYLPVNEAYQTKHYMHEILILGYDDEKQTFMIQEYVNHVFREIEVEQSKVVPFENCSYYGDDVVMKLYRKRKSVFPFDKKAFLLQIKDFYESVNPYYRLGGVYGNYFNPWDKAFGMEAYGRMVIYLQSLNDIDYRILKLIQEHFDGMRRKLDFIRKEGYIELAEIGHMIEFYAEAAIRAKKIVILGVKQSMVPEEKGIKIKERVMKQLEELIEDEKQILKTFLERVSVKELA